MVERKAPTKKETKPRPAKVAPAPRSQDQAPSQAVADTRNALQKRSSVVGTVVSDKMSKTIVVQVDRRVRHREYQKFVVKSRRFKAHDEKNDAKMGDIVSLVESRPLSRDKRWVLQSIIRRAGQTADANV